VITKRKRLGKVQVTFVQPPADEPVYIAGTFNEWIAEPLKLAKDGTLRATVSAESGQVLEFRYVTASGHWFDDEQADELVGNDQGTANCLLRI
jgi:hypothetical protein